MNTAAVATAAATTTPPDESGAPPPFDEQVRALHARHDRLFAAMLVLQWLALVAVALLLQPGAPHGSLTLLVGGAVVSLPGAAALLFPGRALTRHVVAAGHMLLSALLMHVSGGRMESHFHVFGTLAFLAFYRDWRVLLTAAAVTTLDTFVRGQYLPESVYGTTAPGAARWAEHLGWVTFEVAFLAWASRQSLLDLRELAQKRALAEENNAALSAAKRALEEANARLAASGRASEERALEATASESWFRALSASSPLGLFEMTLSGSVRYVNERFLSVTGLPRERALGDGWREAVHPDDRGAVLERWRAAVTAEEEFADEFRVVWPGGAERWVELRACPFRDPGSPEQRATGYVGAVADITERRRSAELRQEKEDAEAALIAAREAQRAAEGVNRAKSQFLANMSHELRTPLNAIIGFSEIMQDQAVGPLTPKQARYIDNVLTSGRHLLQLINDVLDLSKIEAGRMGLEYTHFLPAAAIRDVRNVVVALANKKGQVVRLEAPDDLPALEADQGKFKQVLYNLLANAVKFTPEGKAITVRAALTADGGALSVSVADEGIGLRPENHERVFGEFEQIDSSYARAQQGTGLGLALTRRFVELHGGAIRVESEGEGKGSTFTFTLPLRRPVDAMPEGIAPQLVAAADRPVVLVVGGDRACSELMRHHLERAGYRVAQAARADEALPAARELRPAVITLDVLLPGAAGWAALNALKSDPVTADIPVVIVSVTQDAAETDAARAVNLGAVACFVKPVDRDRLIRAIDSYAAHGDGAAPRRGKDASGPRVLVVDDDPRTVEMLAMRMERRGFEVVPAYGGEQALERALSERPDLIVLDLMMPEVSGFDVVDRLRATPELRETPVLIYTANDVSEESRERLTRHVQAITAKGGAADLLAELDRVLAAAAKRVPTPKEL